MIVKVAKLKHIDPFVPNAPFFYPLKTSENRKVRKGVLGTNELKLEPEAIYNKPEA